MIGHHSHAVVLLRNVITRILLSASLGIASLSLAQSADNPDTQLAGQRAAYARALELIKAGKWKTLRKTREKLRDYPLYPYLIYADLAHRLVLSRHEEVSDFLKNWGDTPIGLRLRSRWLDYLARRNDGDRFIDFFEATTSTVAQQCFYYLTKYRSGEKEQAIAEGLKLWSVGKSQPSECDRLFGILIDGHHVSEELAWQRFNAALLNHQHQLARYLERFFTSPHYIKWYKLFYRVDREPRSIAHYNNFVGESSEETAVLEQGLMHLAKANPIEALKHWSRYQQTHQFSVEAHNNIVAAIIKSLYKTNHQAAADSYLNDHKDVLDASLIEWRIREALRELDWESMRTWIARLPDERQQLPVWRYWKIRALESDIATTQNPQIEALTASLARERDFYGFLASDRLQKEYSINNLPLQPDQNHIDLVGSIPGIRRAHELFYHGDWLYANREWLAATNGFAKEDWLAAAIIASQWKWHSMAIASMGQAKYWDDMEIRFPLVYTKQFDEAAKQTNIPNYTLYALARQESAFNSQATSSAGAMGLIQVMPATASLTARKFKLPYSHKENLHDPDINVPIGAHYYKSMLDRFDNNRILATAAYNAGPERVASWLSRSAGKLPFDIWIELIPFAETNAYVRSVLMYSVIYSRKLGLKAPMLEQHERDMLL